MSRCELALATAFVIAMAALGWMAGGSAFEPHYTERMVTYGASPHICD